MFRKIYRIAGLMLAIAFLSAFVPLSVSAATPDVQPTSGPRGTKFTFHVTGLRSDQLYNYYLVDPQMKAHDGKNVLSGNSGTAEWTWTAWSDAKLGEWRMVLVTGSGESDLVIIPFTVTDSLNTSGASITVSPDSGPRGTVFSFHASGFEANSNSDYYLVDPNGTAQSGTGFSTNANGEADWTWHAPDDAVAGTWQLVARLSNATATERIIISFEVTGDAIPVTNDFSVTPSSGTRGTVFTFKVTGFTSKVNAGYYFVAPDGTAINGGSFTTSESGNGEWKWTAPANAQAGTWKAVANDPTKDASQRRVITFEITDTELPTVADIVANPTSGAPGTTFQFAATGFKSGELIRYWASTPDGQTLSDDAFIIFANGDGYATWSWTAPSDAANGIWLMVARGADSQTQRSIQLTISGEQVSTPVTEADSGVAPAVGSAGTTFAFYVTGLKAGERYTYWTSDPSGTASGSDDYYGFTAANGRADLTWTAPSDATPGTWLMVVYGMDTHTTKTVEFTIQ